VAGAVYDLTGGYGPFLFAGAIGCALGGLIIISLPSYPRWGRKSEQDAEVVRVSVAERQAERGEIRWYRPTAGGGWPRLVRSDYRARDVLSSAGRAAPAKTAGALSLSCRTRANAVRSFPRLAEMIAFHLSASSKLGWNPSARSSAASASSSLPSYQQQKPRQVSPIGRNRYERRQAILFVERGDGLRRAAQTGIGRAKRKIRKRRMGMDRRRALRELQAGSGVAECEIGRHEPRDDQRIVAVELCGASRMRF
jgi:hypothetical protein